jgi:hypothetical protein
VLLPIAISRRAVLRETRARAARHPAFACASSLLLCPPRIFTLPAQKSETLVFLAPKKTCRRSLLTALGSGYSTLAL